MNTKNKVALVTGGARRLGKEISLTLAGLGYDIILNYNDSGKSVLEETISMLNKTGVNVSAVKCDISNVNEIRKMFRAVSIKYKKLDVLVNNAAIFRHTEFLETTEKIFDKFINTNLKSVFFCSQEAAKLMIKNDEPHCRIINIASLGGIENWTGYIPYSLSKIGVIKLTELTAKKLAPKILVNAVAPGTILLNNGDNDNVNPEEVRRYPMNRFAGSKDITSLITYLVNENNYITGQTFVVDGGRSL
ncbi:MAG: SDR family oxidoreductase [Bacteroidetes bacterium]|nr:SDR family oxidoreductase [Bacteroidota bacterium]